jgi:hypothetical protein
MDAKALSDLMEGNSRKRALKAIEKDNAKALSQVHKSGYTIKIEG